MNTRLNSRRVTLALATFGVIGMGGVRPALAASQTWVAAPTDANWSTAANWSGNAVPGSTTTTTNDVATFNTAIPISGIGGASNPIVIDSGRRIGSIIFGSATVDAGPYVIGATGGNTLLLSAQNAGTNGVTISAAVTSSQTLAGPMQMTQPSSQSDPYAFVNNSTTTSANLIVSGGITATNTTRGWAFVLDGTNTGNNIISGSINATITTASGYTPLTKNGAGTWILSGANIFNGAPVTSTGFAVNAGTLVLENNAALGTTAGAKLNLNGGAIELNASSANGSITSDNGLTITAATGATVRSNGTNTANSTVSVSTAAASSVTLSTVNSSDVFTVGNGANDITGGSSTSVIHTAGPGAIVLGQASNYVGGYSVDAGTLQIGNATALGAATTANVVFGSTAGLLQLNGVSTTIVGLQGASATSSAVESASGSNTLTINNAAANQYGGVLRDGAGQLSIVKSGAGVLALTGASTYTGNTTVSNGQLLANNTSGSATGTGNTLTASGNAVVGGSGTIGSAVTLNANSHLAPGATAGAVGTLTVSSLTLGTGTNLDYDITSTSVLDKTIVTTANGLTINGGTLNINGGATALTTNGVYNLIGYTGVIGGTGTSALTINAANTSPATNSYTFGSSGGFVTLTIASTGATIDYWNADADGNWSTGPWTPAQPNGAGAFASFGGGGVPITANRTITVDAAKTVGTIAFNNAAGKSYTIAGANTITLNNNANPAFVTDSAGTHAINAPIALSTAGNTVTVTNAADTLTFGGAVSGTGAAITKLGAGTLAMTGVNTYDGGTFLNGGTIQINSPSSLGATTGNLDFAGGTLQLLADVTTTRTYTANANDADVKIDTNGHNLTQNGTILAAVGGLGGLVKSGGGTLTLAGTNTYVGTTTINAGTVAISSNANLGDPTASGALVLNGTGALQSTASLSLDNTRPVTVNTSTAQILPDTGTVLTVPGVFTDSQAFTYNGLGTLLLAANNLTTFSSNITLNSGTLALGGGNSAANNNNNNALGTGTVTFQGGTLSLNGANVTDSGQSSGIANNLVVATGQTGTLITGARSSFGGTLTGGGTLNYAATGIRGQLANGWAGFTGTINFTAEAGVNGGTGDVRMNSTLGFPTAKINLGTGVNLYTVLNFGAPSNATTGQVIPIGELSGSGNLAGGTVSGRIAQYVIGALNTSSTYSGFISNSTGQTAITKVGSGTLTLTAANSYSGTTTISAGTLNINGINALGGANYGSAAGAQTGGIANAGLWFNGGTLQYASAGAGGLTSSGDITADAVGNVRNVYISSTATIDTNGNTVTYANPIGNAGTGGLTKAGAGTLVLNGANNYTGGTAVNGGTLQVHYSASSASASTPLLSNAAGTDIKNGAVVFDYTGDTTPAATIRTLLTNSFNNGAGVMNTGQLFSSAATANRGLGYADDGVSQVKVLSTLFGDADLDGGVSINDFNLLSQNFGKTGKIWSDGDFDYDGGVSINDFNLLSANFGKTTPTAADDTGPNYAALVLWDFAVAHNDQAGFIAATGVPEPTTLGLLAGGAMLGLRRRRRAN